MSNAAAVRPSVLTVAAKLLGLLFQAAQHVLQPPGVAALPLLVMVMESLCDLTQSSADSRQVSFRTARTGELMRELLVDVN